MTFSRYSDQLQVFTLQAGHYQELTLPEPQVWLPEIGFGLGLWQGEYAGIEQRWLRWFDANRDWILTEAEQERQRAERLAERLRALGLNPEDEL